jgi:hypothetical protein
LLEFVEIEHAMLLSHASAASCAVAYAHVTASFLCITGATLTAQVSEAWDALLDHL